MTNPIIVSYVLLLLGTGMLIFYMGAYVFHYEEYIREKTRRYEQLVLGIIGALLLFSGGKNIREKTQEKPGVQTEVSILTYFLIFGVGLSLAGFLIQDRFYSWRIAEAVPSQYLDDTFSRIDAQLSNIVGYDKVGDYKILQNHFKRVGEVEGKVAIYIGEIYRKGPARVLIFKSTGLGEVDEGITIKYSVLATKLGSEDILRDRLILENSRVRFSFAGEDYFFQVKYHWYWVRTKDYAEVELFKAIRGAPYPWEK